MIRQHPPARRGVGPPARAQHLRPTWRPPGHYPENNYQACVCVDLDGEHLMPSSPASVEKMLGSFFVARTCAGRFLRHLSTPQGLSFVSWGGRPTLFDKGDLCPFPTPHGRPDPSLGASLSPYGLWLKSERDETEPLRGGGTR